jgi:hypothetical protein
MIHIWLKNGRNAPVRGSFHFFLRIVDFGSICFYVRIKSVFDFFKNLMLEKINLVLNLFKYIL